MNDPASYLKEDILKMSGRIVDTLENAASQLKRLDVDALPEEGIGPTHQFMQQVQENMNNLTLVMTVLTVVTGGKLAPEDEDYDPRSGD
jgi:hypothetical protein